VRLPARLELNIGVEVGLEVGMEIRRTLTPTEFEIITFSLAATGGHLW
jgi:hypothetical protein